MRRLDTHGRPSPPIPMPTLWPGPTFQWRSGDRVVMPRAAAAPTAAELVLGVADARHVALVHSRCAAVTARVAGASAIGVMECDHVVTSSFSRAGVAVLAVLAAVDDAADADGSPAGRALHVRAHRRHAADDLVAGHAGQRRPGHPAHLVEVGWHAAERSRSASYGPCARRVISWLRGAGRRHGRRRPLTVIGRFSGWMEDDNQREVPARAFGPSRWGKACGRAEDNRGRPQEAGFTGTCPIQGRRAPCYYSWITGFAAAALTVAVRVGRRVGNAGCAPVSSWWSASGRERGIGICGASVAGSPIWLPPP